MGSVASSEWPGRRCRPRRAEPHRCSGGDSPAHPGAWGAGVRGSVRCADESRGSRSTSPRSRQCTPQKPCPASRRPAGRLDAAPGTSERSISPRPRQPPARSHVRAGATAGGSQPARPSGRLRHPSNHRPDEAGSIRATFASVRPSFAACRRAFNSTYASAFLTSRGVGIPGIRTGLPSRASTAPAPAGQVAKIQRELPRHACHRSGT